MGQRQLNLARGDKRVQWIQYGIHSCRNGRGTGGGAAPVIARIAREEGALVVAVCNISIRLERSRKKKADWSIEQLSKHADTTVVIENDKLLSYAPNLPMEKAFDLIDSIASNAVKGIADTITHAKPDKPGLRRREGDNGQRRNGNDKYRTWKRHRQGRKGDKVNTVIHLLDVDLEGQRARWCT